MGCVLVVDDNTDSCEALGRLIRRLGHDSYCLHSGESALEFLTKHPVDVVILDVMMPGVDGMEVLRKIRNEMRLTSLPVVLFSAVSDFSFQLHAKEKGASDYWVKGSFDFGGIQKLLAPWVKDLPPDNCPPASDTAQPTLAG